MWNQKIGLSIGNQYAIPTTEVIQMLAQIGFDAVSPEWNAEANLENIVKTAADCGLSLQSLHAPYLNTDALWNPDPDVFGPVKSRLFSALKDCSRYNIPVMVMHAWIGFDYTFDKDSLYFGNFDYLVNFAGQNGVHIAFENTEGEEFLFALMEHYKDNPWTGFCWDSGQEMCYNRSRDLLALYGDRLLMTHLNDNLGISRFDGKIFWTDDLHLLPFDGIADWDDNIDRLKKSRKLEILNFELNLNSKPGRHENDIYRDMPLELYFTEAYKRACKIAYRYAK